MVTVVMVTIVMTVVTMTMMMMMLVRYHDDVDRNYDNDNLFTL